MDKLPSELIKYIHTFYKTQELTKSLLINKFQHLIIYDSLNTRWPVDEMRIKLIFRLWYKKTRPIVIRTSRGRGYSNSWTRPTYEPSERVILLG